MYAEQFRDPSVRSRWIYWLGVTFIVPVCVNEVGVPLVTLSHSILRL